MAPKAPDGRRATVDAKAHDPASGGWASALNLVLPGGGLILIGAVGSGLVAGLLFAACANFALVAVLLFPDDYSGRVQALLIGLAAGCYIGVQVRFVRSLRSVREQGAAASRRAALARAQQLQAAGDAYGALAVLEALAAEAAHDLLVAYRLAQARTAIGDVTGARGAWQRVRRLDEFGIYRQQVADQERQLNSARGGRAPPDAAPH